MLLALLDRDLVVGDAIVNSHCEVGNHSEGGNEGSQDVEHAFLLGAVSTGTRFGALRLQWRWVILTTGTRNAIM